MLKTKIDARPKDGGWQAIVNYKANGKWSQKTKQGYRTEKEALGKAKEIEFELQQEFKSGVIHSDMTVGELRDIWLDFKRQEGRAEETIITYEKTTNILNPLFAEKVRDITEFEITCLILELRKNTGHSYHEHQRMIRTMFAFAIQTLQIIPRNPAKKIESTYEDKRTKYIKDEEVPDFMERTRLESMRLAIRIMAETGCRTGEAFGITISDLTPYQIDINKQMSRRNYSFAPLKNKGKGKRICPISKELYRDILSFYNSKTSQNLDGRIFEKRFNVYGVLRKFGTSPHCLRHTHATDLVAMGVNPVEAAALIGDTYQTFASTYIHSNKAEREKAVNIIRDKKLSKAK